MKRVILLWFPDSGFRSLLNPETVEQCKEILYLYENCLSFADWRVRVPRPSWTAVRYQDEQLVWHEERFEGKVARLVLHEIDHTNGILHIHRMEKGDRPLTVTEYDAMAAPSATPSSPTAIDTK